MNTTITEYNGKVEATALGDMLPGEMYQSATPLNNCVLVAVDDSYLGSASTIEVAVSSSGAPAALIISATGYYVAITEYGGSPSIHYYGGGDALTIPVDGGSSSLQLGYVGYEDSTGYNENPEIMANCNGIAITFELDKSSVTAWGLHSVNLVIKLGEA